MKGRASQAKRALQNTFESRRQIPQIKITYYETAELGEIMPSSRSCA